ncbi:MAG: tetratricopeptide repeat protein [Cyclobacteriaceae bacterium]
MRSVILLLILLLSFSAFSQRKKSRSEVVVPQTQEDSVRFEAVIVEAEKQLILENYAKALESFTTALEMNSESAAVNFKISEVLAKSKEGQKAIPFSMRAIELDPDNKFYQLSLARLYQSVGFFIDATKTYENLLLKYPADESTLYELAELYQNLGRIDEMFLTFDKIEENLGVKVEIVRERQRILMKNRNLDGVIAEYEKLINAYPNEAAYRIELIDFLIQNKRTEEAAREIETYENEESPSSRISLLKSELAWMDGDREKAFELLESVFETSAIDFETKFQILTNYLSMTSRDEDRARITRISKALADDHTNEYRAQAFVGDLLYQSGDKEMAVTYYLKAIRISPANFSVWQNIINVEAELNNYDSVLVHAEQALEYFPNQAMLYYFAGTGHLIKNDYKKSIRSFEQGRKYTVDPDLLTVFYGQLGDAYNGLSDHEKSDQSYEKALRNQPDNDHVLNNYSYFLSLRKEDLEKALEMSTRLIELHPENPTYLDTHGWVLYVNGKYKESRKFLEKAVSLDEDGTVFEHYGDVLFQLGDIDGAIKQWEKARDLGEASENIDKKIADRKLYE